MEEKKENYKDSTMKRRDHARCMTTAFSACRHLQPTLTCRAPLHQPLPCYIENNTSSALWGGGLRFRRENKRERRRSNGDGWRGFLICINTEVQDLPSLLPCFPCLRLQPLHHLRFKLLVTKPITSLPIFLCASLCSVVICKEQVNSVKH